PRPAPAGGRRGNRFRVNQWFAIATGLLSLATLTGIVIGVVAIVRLSDERELVVDHLDPAAVESLRLANALVSEETGVRGYVLAGDATFLAPYRAGRVEERRAVRRLRVQLRGAGLDELSSDLAEVERRAHAWRTRYARPTIARVRQDGAGAIGSAGVERGQRLFEALRRALERQEADLARAREDGRDGLAGAATFLSASFGGIALLVVAALATTLIMLRRTVTLPIGALARRVRRVAAGEFDAPVRGAGPRDIADLAADVDSMRQRIVAELASLRDAHAQLDEQARDLERSNAELEQFAYVASHDLQEPLRKVASFCQLLEQRYRGQLDDRADQYIDFAVDGAKRMQQLINDLLAFSRVGRTSGDLTPVDLGETVRRALADLDSAVADSGATIEVGELPMVRGDASLLTLVFQNLIGNAIKFRSDAPPEVRIASEREGDDWVVTCSDNGIGIEPEYAERVFVIFQRLHGKDQYAGTGIGLAMCRKIVEHHGGRIWLDPGAGPGTTFRFTLPALEESR
ncbi:MAG TPA: ATP-binding protein, partial [Thermoleophilaceae bacterium]|nr:ATP-binding protein [Thermoleophilaceae bacterium]